MSSDFKLFPAAIFSSFTSQMHKKLSFDARKDQPFFVHTLGWSSIDPCATWKLWGLVCRQLMVDDICLVLIRQLGPSKKSRSQTVPPQTGALPFTEQAVTISHRDRTE
ncbi:unnamed protein product [Echinostoma caproni]|uniref:AXH domain-containing protein n=1 Tax=Echinostoma caproni TaxID=27848 RepID=A0A183A6G4_9TREM|nr:unnamed protein product [Echinostoma caproni]